MNRLKEYNAHLIYSIFNSNLSMASSEVITQKFFKGILEEEIDTYKDSFNLSLSDYDITDEEIQSLTALNDKTVKLTSLDIRLSNWLTNEEILGKFFRKLFKKKQFESFAFYINELNQNLFNLFIDFLSKINSSVTSLAIRIKYKSKDIERECLMKVLNVLITTNHSLTTIDLSNNFFDTEELMNSLKKLLNKKTYEDISINISKMNKCSLIDIDLSNIDNLTMENCNISSMSSLPLISLEMSVNNISKASLLVLSNCLSQTKTLKAVNLSNNYLGNAGCVILSKGIALNQSLTSLTLSSNFILDDGVIAIANSLTHNTTISKLDFKKNYISSQGIISFCSILDAQPHNRFVELDFTANSIEEDGLYAYAQFLSKHNKCKQLAISAKRGKEDINKAFGLMKSLDDLALIDLYSMELKAENMSYINDILMSNSNIQQIILSNNKDIMYDGINYLSSGIERNKNLTHIFLSQCNIGDDGCVVLANALFNNISIKELHLDYNKIGINGSRSIGEKVIRKRSLNTLNLEHNLIDYQAAYFIGKYLEEAYGIKSLSLNSNPIGDEGCIYIANGIKGNDTLNSLNLNNIQMTNKGIRVLAIEICSKPNITRLNVSSNQITDIEDEFYKLFDYMATLKIADNPISSTGIIRVFHGSENNHMLKALRFSSVKLQNEIFSFKTSNKYLKSFDLSYTELSLSFIKSLLSLKNISYLNIQHLEGKVINDEAMGKICKYITENNCPLKTLLLQNNSITGKGAEYIAEMLNDENSKLIELNIADNPISAEGMNSIFQSLKEKNNTLKIFNVNYCGLNDYSARHIYSMLVKNKKLGSISLHANKMTDIGVDMILSSLRLNKTLKKLSIGNNNTSDRALENIDKYLMCNSTLLYLEIKKGQLSTVSMGKIAKVLRMKQDSGLRVLNFVNNNISYELMCKIALSIEKNTNMNEIKLLLNGANGSEQNELMASNPHIVIR